MPPVTTSAAALQNLQAAQSSQQTPEQIADANNQSLGVNAAQGQVSGLRQAITNTTNLLNNVAPTVYGNTQGSLVTSAQAGQQIQNKSAPIQQTLSGQNTDLTNDQSNLSDLLSQANSKDTLDEQSQSDNLTNLENIYKDLYGQEQDSAAAQQKAAEDAEATREFNAGLSEKASSDSASAKTPTAAQAKAADQATTLSNLQSVQGGDGHVNETNWANAMNQWISAGYSASDFVSNFGQFINPKYSSTYQGSGTLF